MAGVDSGPHIADALLPLEDGVVHGQNQAPGAGGFHDPQVGQLPLRQDGLLKAFEGVTRAGGHTDGPLGSVGQDVGVRGGDVQSLKDPLDGGEVLRVFLGLPEQDRVFGVL